MDNEDRIAADLKGWKDFFKTTNQQQQKKKKIWLAFQMLSAC